ncbi:unnamed protein product [Effrenium voratum]|uniref:Uncharacterized protein n=2 Tax=Effrenium voratum TaxID=2562239 RepID=A0AA36MPY1_9DINO|nr:unnamed protein product [Effrenium voratum]
MQNDALIQRLKGELQEAAEAGIAECRAAEDLRKRNDDLQSELVECKLSPPLSTLSTSSEWRWPTRSSGVKARGSITSSEGGVAGPLRKQHLAAQFDADMDEYIRENEELKEKVTTLEKANRELEKVTAEINENQPRSPQSPAGSAKVGLQVQHVARNIARDRAEEELKREVEIEKCEVAALQQSLEKFKREAAFELQKARAEVEEERAAKERDIRKTEQAREKEVQWLHNELDAAKLRYIARGVPRQSPGPSEVPAFGKPEKMASILIEEPASLADELGHFVWPAEEDSNLEAEISELREELQMMEQFHAAETESSHRAKEELAKTEVALRTEIQEVQGLRRALEAQRGAEVKTEKIKPSEEAETAEKPAKAEKAETAEKPAKAEKAETAEKPAKAEKAETAEKPAKAEKAETAEKPAKAEKAETAEKPAKAEKAETAEKPAKTEKAETAEKPAKAEKAETAEKPAKAEKAETAEKPAKTEKVEPREKTKDAKNATAQDASDKKGLKATKDVSKDAKGMESKNDAIKKEALEMAKQELQGALKEKQEEITSLKRAADHRAAEQAQELAAYANSAKLRERHLVERMEHFESLAQTSHQEAKVQSRAEAKVQSQESPLQLQPLKTEVAELKLWKEEELAKQRSEARRLGSERAEAEKLKAQAAALFDEADQERQELQRMRALSLQEPSSPSKAKPADSEMLRTLAALRYIDAHLYP